MALVTAGRYLKRALAGEVLFDEPMARHTTYRIGGPADLYITCETLADLTETLSVLTSEDVPWLALGKGSNMLVADAGYRGAVIVLGKEFKGHSADGAAITAGAGCILAYVVRDAFSLGLSGLESSVGIPGTLGGAIAMNAGTRDDWIGRVVESVTVCHPELGLERVHGADVEWGYRTSGLADRGVMVEATLRLEPAERTALQASMDAALGRRKRSQPLGQPSAGSVFVNPPDDSAGRLIEAAGLKGTRLGGAMISDVHANFIVNRGGASAADVLGLIRKVQMTVRDRNGIELKPEIKLVGSFEAA